MSLNGLDDPSIVEAFGTVTAEPGSWFLIKYSSRDEVELLSRGTGGIVEVRGAIEGYEEESPLYGFLRYRRRNVIIKYLPEDCSRLIQARVAVHFNAVCERFSPYDTIFEIATASELRDTKLSAACSLHAASGSNSSSISSQRRKRLGEIAEEDEEEPRAPKRQSLVPDPADDRPQSPAANITDPVTLNSDLAASPEQRKFSSSTTSEPPKFVGSEERSSTDLDPSRPDLYSYASYPYSKPKVKLGPRPSIDASGRPQTAGTFRPISAIPAGFKFFGKGNKKSKDKEGSPVASPQEELAGMNFGASDDSLKAPSDSTRPATSSGLPSNTSAATAAPSIKQTITPEKARLMKAMKLREKKKQMSLQAAAAVPSIEIPAAEDEVQDDASKEEDEAEDKQTILARGDSAVGLNILSSLHADHVSDLTQSDSHPGSPVIASSDADQSTKASSISESTDETVQAKEGDIPSDREVEIGRSSDDEPTKPVSEEAPVAEEAATEEPKLTSEDLDKAEIKQLETNEEEKQPQISHAVQDTAAALSTNEACTEPHASEVALASDVEEKILADEPSNAPEPLSLPISKFSTNMGTSPESPRADSVASPTTSEATSPRLRIPRSKFSTQDLMAAAKAAAQPTVLEGGPVLEDSPSIVSSEPTVSEPIAEPAAEHDDSDTETIPAGEELKRRTLIEPIKTNLGHSRNVSRSESHLLDDEDLMQELQSATVEEAKPMLVKTPRTPVFPHSAPPISFGPHVIRTVSNPVRGALIVPMDVTASSARSLSSGAAYLHKVTQQPTGGNLSMKSNVGSSISQRIKALEKLSASTGEIPQPPPSRDRPSSTFFSVKKREPSRSPSVVDRTSPFRKQTPPSPSQSGEDSPDGVKFARRERSNSVASRLSMFESPPGAPGHSPGTTQRGRPESISVTARIIRDPNSQPGMEPPRDPSEYSRLDLKQSPLLVDHQRAMREPAPVPVDSFKDQRSGSQDDGKSRQSSLSLVKGFMKERRKSITSDFSGQAGDSASPSRPTSVHQNNSFTHRLSISSRSSISKDRDQISPSALQESFGDDSKSNSDKKLSRAGRFMRRLSTLSGSRTKASTPPALSPTLKEEPETVPPRPVTTAGAPWIVSYMGDVNVQFPDNLLWKRRNMCLDSQGFLILSALPASQGGRPAAFAQGTKRYHMGDFRMPYVPDVEIQELPNSVVLDFLEGTGIQVACEDRAGQRNILNILQDAHSGHTRFGQ